MTTIDTLRNSDLRTMVDTLKAQHARKHDVIVPARSISAVTNDSHEFGLMVPDPEAITLDGVGTTHFAHVGGVAMGQLAGRTGIPVSYLRTITAHSDHTGLAVDNVNHWLARDAKTVLLRTFLAGDDQTAGFVRALLSDRFATIDHIDAIMATLEGFKAAGVTPQITGCDLTESKLYVRFSSPEVAINIGELVRNYEYNGRSGRDLPLMNAGLVLSNSETGGGAYTLTPRVTVQVCTNGLTITKDAYRRVHLGDKLEEGVVKWSDDTISKTLELVSAKTRDMVTSIISTEYLETVAEGLRTYHELEVKKPEAVCKVVGKHLKYTDDQIDTLLSTFIGGRDLTVLGVGQAVTALAQEAETGEDQDEMESGVWEVMAVAATAARSGRR